MSYQEALVELERNHYYPKPVGVPGGSDVAYLKLPTSPVYKDDRLQLMKGVLPPEFKLKWDKSQAAIIIEKK
jgi:hypothetical protein